jgi:mitogen-activated protein kinase 7
MAADLSLQGRKTFKVFNQDFIVDERYVVTKELGQGAYGIVWLVKPRQDLQSKTWSSK